MNIYTTLSQAWQADAPVLRDASRTWTGADLDRAAGQRAAFLAASGLAPGERVAVHMDHCAEALCMYLGVLRAGLVAVPLDAAPGARHWQAGLADAQPRLLACRPEAAGLAPAGLATWTFGEGGSLSSQLPAAGDFPAVERNPDDLAVLLYGSGTSGHTRAAMLSHANLAANAAALIQHWALVSGDVALHALPLGRAAGLFVGHALLAAGARLHLQPPGAPAALAAALPGASLCLANPRDYAHLTAEPALTFESCARLRLAVSAGQALPRRVARAFQERSGHALTQCYALAEAGVVSAHRWGEDPRPATVGKPLPGQRLRVLGENLKPMPLEHYGRVYLRGPNVCSGWWRRPEDSGAAFDAEGWYRSDDIAWWDEQDCATLFGRAEDVIRSGVYQIQPCEVEEALQELPGIAGAAVLGVKHAEVGEAVLALVVRDAQCALDEADIIAAAAAALGAHKAPRQVRFVAELPRDVLGRVQRNALKRRHAS